MCVCVWSSTSCSLAGFAGSKTCDLVCTLLAKESSLPPVIAAYHSTALTPLTLWPLLMTCLIFKVIFHIYTLVFVASLKSLSRCMSGTCIGKLEVGEVWIAILSATLAYCDTDASSLPRRQSIDFLWLVKKLK